MKTRSIYFSVASLLAGCFALAGLAAAQDYPSRPIRMIVPYGTGGVTDITSRIVAPRMADILGQSIVIENRAGGASMLGTDAVAKSRPDGYTVLLTSTALAANHILFKKIPYDPVKDLVSVSLLSTVPTVLVVHPGVPANSVKDLVDLVKAKPGSINYGSAGNGSGNHLTTEVFKHAAGIDVQHIPYKGGGAVMTDLVGGQVTFVFAVLPTAYPYITSGKLRALGVSSLQRSAALPDVPTVAESGYPGFSVAEWLGIFVPAGTPPAIVERLNNAATRALQHPEVQTRLKALGAEIIGGQPGNMDKYLRAEIANWTRLAQQVKFEVTE
jgi:tripartite-type tricarboxylate transporter receptor subunit TctC